MTDLMTLQQHRLLSRLYALAREQGRALKEDRLDHFLDLMEVREQVLAELLAVESEPPPANVLPLPTIRASAGDPDVRDALRGIISSIIEQDETNERELRSQMGVIATTIQHLHQGAVAGRGYAAVMSAVRGETATSDFRA